MGEDDDDEGGADFEEEVKFARWFQRGTTCCREANTPRYASGTKSSCVAVVDVLLFCCCSSVDDMRFLIFVLSFFSVLQTLEFLKERWS